MAIDFLDAPSGGKNRPKSAPILGFHQNGAPLLGAFSVSPSDAFLVAGRRFFSSIF
jgi:hypothetical protein